jgi:hypothetical protein
MITISIHFHAHTVPNLASEYTWKPAPVSFWHVPNTFWACPYSHKKVLKAHIALSLYFPDLEIRSPGFISL